MYRYLTREDWGAALPHGSYTPVVHRGHGTVHYSASNITPGHVPATAEKPAKPGPKWYAIWRDPVTAATQRRRVSHAIRAYNRALKAWREGGTLPPKLDALERRIAREIQAFHQGPSRNWLDIAYHRLILASGTVIECRPLGAQGAHARYANWTVGYCFVMGPGDRPTPEMLASFERQREKDGITKIAGHRQRPGNATSCPGDALILALGL